MAGMGSFSRQRQYRQESPSNYTGVLAKLLGNKQEGFKDVVGAVDDYGQGLAGSKVAELMGQEGFYKLSPEEAQAAVVKATGGREMSKQMMEQLGLTMDNKENVQKNTWNEEAATLDHKRKIQRDSINNSATAKLYGTDNVDRGTEYVRYNNELRTYDEQLKRKDLTQFQREELLKAKDDVTYKLAKISSGGKPTSHIKEKLFGYDSPTSSKGTKKNPKWNTKLYAQTDPSVRSFIDSKYGKEVIEGKDGFYFRGQKLTPSYLLTLKGK